MASTTRTEGRLFYVTCAARAGSVRIVVGPFESHEEALAFVEPARREAVRRHPDLTFSGFGVTSGLLRRGAAPKTGRLNEAVGYVPAPRILQPA